MKKALLDLPAPGFCRPSHSPKSSTDRPDAQAPSVVLDESYEQESDPSMGIVAGMAAGAVLWGVLILAIGIAY
jgi:hypothetical protein